MKAPKPRAVRVALKPSPQVGALIVQAKTIVEKMTGNPHFPSPTPSLAKITADIAALEAAQTLAVTKAKGAVEDRNAKQQALLADLHLLAAYVQNQARADLTNAEAIISSSSLSLKKINPHPKQDFTVKLGLVSGSVRLVAKALLGRVGYEWQWSLDEKVWTSLPNTVQAHTSVVGLNPNVLYYFRGRTTTKVGMGDWGAIVSIQVR